MKPPADHTTSQRQLDWWARDAVVYFIGAGQPLVAVKIGVSTWSTVARRLAALQSSNHEPLELLGVIPYRGIPLPMKEAETRERSLHLQFARWQRTREGKRGYEWFTAVPELLAFIAAETQPPATFGFRRAAR
ncbi:MAG: GIY-YIG nuclease family protein [Opitutaceae bacterium]|jgi:hypothetical protein